MVYNYLLDLYQTIKSRRQAIQLKAADAATLREQKFAEGQLDTLREFTDFLYKNYHAKLPRRAQKDNPRDIFNEGC